MSANHKNKGGNTVSVVTELAKRIADELALTIWDVEFVKEGASYFLRIYIDKDEPVTIEDCENFSRKIDKLLDEADPIEESYYLEVSSPGIERELKKPHHFKHSIGRTVTIRRIRPKDGQREFTGKLVEYTDKKQITIQLPDGTFEAVDLKECAFVKLYTEIHFDETEPYN